MRDLKDMLAEFQQKIRANTTGESAVVYRCEACHDAGFESITGPKGEERVRNCTQCDYWARKRGIAPGIPDDETDSTFDNYTPAAGNADAVEQAKLFVDGVHPNLYLFGGVGTGKTRLACTILNALWKKPTPPRCLFMRTPELLLKLQPDGAEEGTGHWFDKVTQVDILALDDVGASQGTDFARRMLQSIYDKRLDLGYRTVFTSNMNLGSLAQFLTDDRLASRIAGSAKVVEVSGKDWRTANAKKQKLAGQKKLERERRTGEDRRQGADAWMPPGDRD